MGRAAEDHCHPAMKEDRMERRPVELGEIFQGRRSLTVK